VNANAKLMKNKERIYVEGLNIGLPSLGNEVRSSSGSRRTCRWLRHL